MSNDQYTEYKDNMLIYWFDFWSFDSGIGLTVNSKIEFYAKPNNATNTKIGSWVEVLSERNNSLVIVKMPPSFIFDIERYVSYESFKETMKNQCQRQWKI